MFGEHVTQSSHAMDSVKIYRDRTTKCNRKVQVALLLSNCGSFQLMSGKNKRAVIILLG